MNTQQLNETISKTLAAWNIPGGAVAVVQGDDVFTQGYGVLEAGKPEAVNADTIFAIGSTTKAFTSALIGMLVDEGKLAWDDLVIQYIPEFELYDDWVARHVTVRDLLCHRLGLERAQKIYYHRGYDQREIIRRMKYLKPAVGFRTGFNYANQQYGVAGLLVEAVTGKSWDDFITERIFNALNMSRSFSGHDRITDNKNFASPHAVLNETYPAGVRFLGEMSAIENFKLTHEPAGSIHTSANDLAQWLKALLNNGAPLLQPNTFNELTTPQVVMQDVLNSELAPLAYLQPATHFWTYALGWWAMDYRGEKVLMHGGQMPGYNSAVAFFPQRKLALAVMVNVHQTLAHAALFYAISDILLDKKDRDWSTEFQMVAQGYMAQVKGQVDEMRLKRDPNLPLSNKLDSYTGTFSNDLFGEMTVIIKDDSLNLKYGVNTATLEHWQGDTFLAHWNLKGLMDDSMIAFSPNGKTMTLLNDRAEYRKTS
ncbi:MAG: serine hydrolase [Anaerolineales bacterium]|uniref:serine hydrolase n=1 Tax=Candidatus Villigracilis vicinus TaxID=3140679 RepID=UPI003135B6C4|nr:serine hydrolase [Anaerolineales bacterium]